MKSQETIVKIAREFGITDVQVCRVVADLTMDSFIQDPDLMSILKGKLKEEALVCRELTCNQGQG